MPAIHSVEEFLDKVQPGQTFWVTALGDFDRRKLIEGVYSSVDVNYRHSEDQPTTPKLNVVFRNKDGSPAIGSRYVRDLTNETYGVYLDVDEALAELEANPMHVRSDEDREDKVIRETRS